MIVALDDKDPSQANNQKKNVKSTLMNKMEPSGLSKKEYLKKYLSGGDKKKKKKKTGQSLITKSKIVDDDIDLNSMQPLDDDELEIYDLAEEAPQIAGIIDERPDELRAMAEYRSSKKWKIVTDEFGIEDVKVTAIDRKTSEDGPPKREKELNIGQNSEKSRISENNANRKAAIKEEEDWQVSPPKKFAIKQEVREDSDPSPPRRRQDNDSDLSPPRRGQDNDSDPSPPRRRREKDSDPSPPRRRREKDSDPSPPRRRREKDSDPSPPRRRQEKDFNRSLPRRTEDNWRRQRDSDPSPPRRREGKRKRQDYIYDSEPFPPKGLKLERNWDSPVSSPSPPPPPSQRDDSRSRNTENFSTKSGRVSDKSEVNGKQRSRSKDKDEDKKVTNNRKDGEYGLKLSTNHSSDSKKEKKSSQLEKTLSGRKAGLQSAEDMRKESESLRKKEKEIFEKMSDDVTGKHAKAIVRDRHTGRRHDAKEEARKKREQEEKEAARIAEYAVWGKGVKQVEDKQNKLQEDLYEMSKPLARYKDDKDLEEMLKNQERDGDPMLEYIRNKKKSDSKQSHRPEYEGSYMPNRYGIKPGHRWDGVDRSNGYEKKWFEEQNAKKAREEEAFKWSTEDM